MMKSKFQLRVCALWLVICITISGVRSLTPQDIGGRLAFQGQDIIGGAAIIFKQPKRVRDLAGNTGAMLAAARRPSRSNRPSEVARNNNSVSDTSRPTAQPTPTTVAAATTENRAEALKEQGNAFYDRGDFTHAIEAYQNALGLNAKDADVYNNLGAAYFNLNQVNEAAAALFQKSISLKSDDAMLSIISARACTKPAVTRRQSRHSTTRSGLTPEDADAFNNSAQCITCSTSISARSIVFRKRSLRSLIRLTLTTIRQRLLHDRQKA